MKRRVLEVTDLVAAIGDLFLPKLRYALELECGHTVLRRTNVHCVNTLGYRVARCERCRRINE